MLEELELIRLLTAERADSITLVSPRNVPFDGVFTSVNEE